MAVLFNNCRGRNHAGLFSRRAFYDLDLTGAQARMAKNLSPGEECIVASKGPEDRIVFDWFVFSHEEFSHHESKPKQVRVLFGNWLKSETLPRVEAMKKSPYAGFFNVLGHFKRPSVITLKDGV